VAYTALINPAARSSRLSALFVGPNEAMALKIAANAAAAARLG
jgi:hypothetical protein